MFGTDHNLLLHVLLAALLIALYGYVLMRFQRVARQRNQVMQAVLQLQEQVAQLQDRALHDHLTGLPNRALLEDRIGQALVKAAREQGNFLILFLDLNGFKPVNDQYGHDAGDRLLVDVGKRIRNVIREEDTVARLGGDEFVILAEIAAATDGVLLMRKVDSAFRQPFQIGAHTIRITASIGKSTYPDDGNTLESLLWTADGDMYANKRNGRNVSSLHEANVIDISGH